MSYQPVDLQFNRLPVNTMRERAEDFFAELNQRRTVRHFSNEPVPREIIELCLKAAGTSPSGANQQPWRFVAVANQEIKKKLRVAAEAEEREFYLRRATDEWKEALSPLGTDEHKPFLEEAPWLIAIFFEVYAHDEKGKKVKRYYPLDSTGIATGILITALHHAGLATLTHTPSPMGFLNGILGRPDNERPFLLLVAGYPAHQAKVPSISRKNIAEYSTFLE